MDPVDEWLGGEFGVDTPKPLKPKMVVTFRAGYDANVWDMGDVPRRLETRGRALS